MNIEEAKLYLEHTSKDDFNLEEHQKENRYQAIQVVLKEIERLNKECDTYMKISTQKQKRIDKAIEYIEENGITEITWWVRRKPTTKELFKDNASLYELLEILRGDKE